MQFKFYVAATAALVATASSHFSYLCEAFSATTSSFTSRNNPSITSSTLQPPVSNKAPEILNHDHLQNKNDPTIRPLHQNWWPVALVNTLNHEGPNSEICLNRDLVLWHDGVEWQCMDDMCSHRYAPLSEGRLFTPEKKDDGSKSRKCIQCSYHGWEFNNKGTCVRIPQQCPTDSDSKTLPDVTRVGTYPVRVAAGMIWVWLDHSLSLSSLTVAQTIPLPVSPMLTEWESQYPQSAYQRDLPYGYELLGENVIDMSHLPFSHHGVLSDRDKGGVHLPFKMLGYEEKEAVCEKESNSVYVNPIDKNQKVLPDFQVKIKDGKAQFADPIFAVNLMGTNQADGNSESYLGFYPPSHIRYHRTPSSGLSSNTELFICPQRPGKCRVLIFNPFEGGMRHLRENSNDGKGPVKKLLSKVGSFLLRRAILSRFMGTTNHLMTNDVFDGDNVFLARQGERLAKNGWTYEDYLKPSTADTMSIKFRKWLDKAADATRQSGEENVAEAAVGEYKDGTSPYVTNQSSNERFLLDRYHSHTKSCPVCSKALAKLERRKKALEFLCPTFFGMAGASLFLAAYQVASTNVLMKAYVKVFGVSFLLSLVMAKLKQITEQTVQKFHYVGYNHQD